MRTRFSLNIAEVIYSCNYACIQRQTCHITI